MNSWLEVLLTYRFLSGLIPTYFVSVLWVDLYSWLEVLVGFLYALIPTYVLTLSLSGWWICTARWRFYLGSCPLSSQLTLSCNIDGSVQLAFSPYNLFWIFE
uniref:Uncharacterized protein n=1 Tax=Cacopsylla melanoneura TaxID=428564 RepID=A0A8D9A6S0_9HEMI